MSVDTSYSLPSASFEQATIVSALNDSDLIIDSVAGSGKTTTAMYIAIANPDKSILLLTYNARLKLETKEKCNMLNITNLVVYSYHSFGVRYIGPNCKTDTGFLKFLESPHKFRQGIKYDIILIDECQDMTPLYYNLVRKILTVLPSARLAVIGDRYQSIYTYNGADARFIALADKLFKPSTWKKLKLSTSYRITNQIARFVNVCALGHNRLTATHDGPVPRYNIVGYAKLATMVVEEIISLMATGLAPTDIFILAPSVKSKNSKSPICMIANTLTANGIPIFVPMHDNAVIDEDITAGKITFSSFHQAKGLERRAVIIVGFDQSYFKYYAKTTPDHYCPNTMYVALTRSKEYLSLYHTNNSPFLAFLNTDELKNCATIRGRIDSVKKTPPSSARKIAVTDMVRHLPSTCIYACSKLIEVIEIHEAQDEIDMPSKIEQISPEGVLYHEEVSDINGIVIPSHYEYKKTGAMFIGGHSQTYANLGGGLISAADYLKITVEYITTTSDLYYPLAQIWTYDWITDEMFDLCYNRINDEIGDELIKHEQSLCTVIDNIYVYGRVDLVSDDRLIELKVTGELTPEHLLQLYVYAYLDGGAKKYQLFNIRSNQLLQLVYNSKSAEKIISMLLCQKFHKKFETTDEEFLSELDIDTVLGEHICPQCSID